MKLQLLELGAVPDFAGAHTANVGCSELHSQDWRCNTLSSLYTSSETTYNYELPARNERPGADQQRVGRLQGSKVLSLKGVECYLVVRDTRDIVAPTERPTAVCRPE